MHTYTNELAHIAADIDTLGVAANETASSTVVNRARSAAVDPVLLSVLSDVRQPDIARARAFGMVAGRLAATGDTPAGTPARTPAGTYAANELAPVLVATRP